MGLIDPKHWTVTHPLIQTFQPGLSFLLQPGPHAQICLGEALPKDIQGALQLVRYVLAARVVHLGSPAEQRVFHGGEERYYEAEVNQVGHVEFFRHGTLRISSAQERLCGRMGTYD